MIAQARLKVVGLLLLAGCATVALRLAHIQLVRHGAYAEMADRMTRRVTTVEERRGSILDRNGKVLALSLGVESVCADPRAVPDRARTAQALAPLLQEPQSEIESRLASPASFVWLKRKVNPEVAERVRALDLPGIAFRREERRYYPRQELACHVLGVVNLDHHGAAGIELGAESWLRGGARRERLARDARGREIVLGAQVLPSGGCDLALTIDATLQAQAEDEIEKAVSRSGAKGGMVLVQDPSTGELLALAALPGFNPNDLGRVPVSRLSGPAVAAYFEPGSIFKLFTLAAALESGLTTPDARVFCERGAMTVADRVIHDHETDGYGWLTVAEVFSNSSNIGMVKIGEKIGPGTLYRFARDFGFGTRTGVALPGETAGRLKSPSARDWYGTTTAMMAFGQEIGATALQIVTAYSAVANGGTLYEPLVIREIRGRDGRVLQRGSPSAVRRVVRPETAAALRALLEKVVQDGTGLKARVPGYRVAGKTGTAQKLEPGKGVRAYSSTRYTASFCGFIPAERPRATILVLLDEPAYGRHHGGEAAAPVFARVAAGVMAALGVPPSAGPAEIARR